MTRTGSAFSFGYLSIGVILVLATLLLLSPSWNTLLAVVAMAILAVIMHQSDRLALVTFLVARPMMDLASETSLIQIGSFSLNISSLFGLLVIAWSVVMIVRLRPPVWRQATTVLMLLMLLLSAISVLVSIDQTVSLRELIRLTSIVGLFLAAVGLAQKQPLQRWVVLAVGASIVIPGLIAFAQLLTNTGLTFGGIRNRVYGTFGHPNVLGFYLVSVMAVVVGWFPPSRRWREHPWLPISLLGLVVLLAATYTRGAWLGLAATGLTYGWLRFRRQTVILTVGLLALLGLFPLLNRLSVDQWNYDLGRVPIIARITDSQAESSSVDWRIEVWTEMRRAVSERPFLGHGLGTFPVLRERQTRDPFQDPNAHNDYLRLGVELGFIGLGIYVITLLALLWASIKAYRVAQTPTSQSLTAALIGLVVAIMIMSFFDNILQATALMWTVWTVVGVFLIRPSINQIKKEPVHS